MTEAHRAILDELRTARRRDPHRGWVHKHLLQGASSTERVSARVDELRKMGWDITSKAAHRGALYRLESLERGQPVEARVSFDLPREWIAALARGELPQEVIDEARRLCPAEQRTLF